MRNTPSLFPIPRATPLLGGRHSATRANTIAVIIANENIVVLANWGYDVSDSIMKMRRGNSKAGRCSLLNTLITIYRTGIRLAVHSLLCVADGSQRSIIARFAQD